MFIKATLCVCGLMALVPEVSQAITITNSFGGSSTGTSVIAVGDTIWFEVIATDDTGPGLHTRYSDIDR